jgi:hypothetical protein
MTHPALKAALAASLLLVLVPNARAQGLAFLHDKVMINGRTCMKDHTHHGKGVHADRKTAQADAVKNWSSFTALEYGDAWGHYMHAAHKRQVCNFDTGAWTCNVEATPCK